VVFVAGIWVLAPAFFVIGVGIGLSFATIPVVALGDAKPDEAGSASGSFSSIQQLASAIGSAAVQHRVDVRRQRVARVRSDNAACPWSTTNQIQPVVLARQLLR
jgi:uncharacterized membrane protein YdjX (TVP38/TMEM64 family)